MKISASVYTNNKLDLLTLIKDLEDHHVDFFHIDCVDNPAVFDDIRRIRSVSDKPIDLHIISSDPLPYLKKAAELGVEYTCIQYENLTNLEGIKNYHNGHLGLAISSSTPLTVFQDLEDNFDFVLLMATEPGKSGGVFNRENFRRIREFQRLYRDKKIHIDGGVNKEVSFIIRNMGVFAAVSGSYLLNADSMGAAMLELKNNNTGSHYLVGDFMMGMEEISVRRERGLNFAEILKGIESSGMGFTILTDDQGKLTGISSNADVRRGLIKNIPDLNKVSTQDVINRKPVCIQENNSVSEMLELIKNQSFPIMYLPVIDGEGFVKGAIKFNNLIKGEL